MTPEEKHLWYDFLKTYPIQFNRQRVIGNYIVDFYCRRANLVIEIDGSQHYLSDAITYDKERTQYLESVNKDISVAIMGCPVNGPLEAKRADIGVAGGKDAAILFKKGQIVRSIPQDDIIKVLKEEIEKF